MKTSSRLNVLFLALACSTVALSAAEEVIAGPKGGRLLETKPHHAEFFVNAEGRAEINFYDAALKPVSPGTQVVAVTAEPTSGRTRLEMEKTPTGFVSRAALPKADEVYRVVVQVRPAAGITPQNFRIDLNLEPCGECKYAEYACTCDH